MTPDELERLAKNHDALPRYTTLPDSCYYWTMRALWDSLKAGRIDREDASAQKKHLLRQYHEFRAAYDNMCRNYREKQDNILRSDLLRSAVSKSDSFTEKLRYAVEAIGVMTGDTVFVKTELAKLEEVLNID